MDPKIEDIGSELRARFAHGSVVVQCDSDVAAHLLGFDLYRALFGNSLAAARLREDGSLASMLQFLQFHLDGPTLGGAVVTFTAAGTGHPAKRQWSEPPIEG